jgi:hypothetical protein
MPEGVPSARYSLVKGERIVRSVLSTRLCEDPCECRAYSFVMATLHMANDVGQLGGGQFSKEVWQQSEGLTSHTAKSRVREIVRAQMKVYTGRPKTLPRSCTVVTGFQL